MSVELDKQELRQQLLSRRKSISPQELEDAGLAVLDHADTWADLSQAQCVALYLAMGNEVPTLPLIHHLLELGKRVLVPRLGSGMQIGWSQIQSDTTLQSVGASWRPLEPDTEVLSSEALSQADCVITAGLAVDHYGVRLGRGGGWYDRALLYKQQQAPVVTMVWPWEVMDTALPVQSHDIRVQGALTPQSLQLWQ